MKYLRFLEVRRLHSTHLWNIHFFTFSVLIEAAHIPWLVFQPAVASFQTRLLSSRICCNLLYTHFPSKHPYDYPFHLNILKGIKSSKSVLPYKVTYSKVLRITMWAPLVRGGHYSAHHITYLDFHPGYVKNTCNSKIKILMVQLKGRQWVCADISSM